MGEGAMQQLNSDSSTFELFDGQLYFKSCVLRANRSNISLSKSELMEAMLRLGDTEKNYLSNIKNNPESFISLL
ncbi:MAG: hypothetical protein Q8P92_02845, partial [Candidatus Daviesbacteria bacterium]|nr:hypothetical protein [Candidatus Daviesbacteria bacterium]